MYYCVCDLMTHNRTNFPEKATKFVCNVVAIQNVEEYTFISRHR